jgi:hypothetical protein
MTARCRRRLAFTLVEMTVSVSVTSLLMVSIGASMVIASRSLPSANAAPSTTIAGMAALTELGEDVSCATRVTERGARAITFTVADRNDADADAETIRYAWSGVAGAPLTRAYNGGTPVTVVSAVRSLTFSYLTRTASESYEAKSVQGPEIQLRGSETANNLADYGVDSDQFAAQYFKPTLPSGTKTFSVTRALYRAAPDGSADSTLLIQLRTALADMTPSTTILGQVSKTESSMSGSMSWYQASFSGDAVSGLSPRNGLALVLAGSDSNNAAKVEYRGSNATLADAAWVQGGPSWSTPTSAKAMQFHVYGKALAPPSGARSLVATRTYLTGVRVTVNPASAADSPYDVTFQAGNEPEVLEAAWDADFSADPTTVDGDGDGRADWTLRSGGALTGYTIAGGLLAATGTAALDTTVSSPSFGGLTTATARFRDTTAGDGGVSLRLNANRSNGMIAPVIATLTLESDGTQTLTLQAVSAASGAMTTIYTCPTLAPSLTTVRLMADAALDSVNLRVNDCELGTFAYVWRAATSAAADVAGASLSLDAGGSTEVDSLSVHAGRAP